MSGFVKWPSIESFRQINHGKAGGTTYRAKVKLHGTNAAITWDGEKVIAQSRTRVITPEDDNLGFAAWVRDSGIQDTWRKDVHVTVFGEWCGKGIQKGVAVSQIDRKIFAVFAALDHGTGRFAYFPETLACLTPEHPDVYILPWCGDDVRIDWTFVSAEVIAQMNEAVAAVETEDPWIKKNFGVSGTGEGLVYYPVEGGRESQPPSDCYADPDSPHYFGRWLFKAKGEKHRVNASKDAVTTRAQLPGEIADFVEFAATEPRFQQGLFELCLAGPDITKTGAFIQWVLDDIRKECSEELAALGDDVKKATGACGAKAAQWFRGICA